MPSSTQLPATMRAAQWRTTTGSIEKNLKLVTNAPLPKTASSLPKGCTLVKVAFASINHDYKLAELPLVNRIFPNPATPGVDYSGTVVATNLTTLKPGQRVFGRTQMHKCGTLAEYVVVGKSGIAPVPAGVSLKDAACVGICGVTALQALAPFVKEGDTVLINGGSGGTGMFAIQVAKALGCARVVAVCSGRNADFCRSLGADDVIDHRKGDLVDTLRKRGEQFDYILDTMFLNTELYWQSHHYLVLNGTYVAIGLPLTAHTFKTLISIHLLPRLFGGGKRRFKFHSVFANPEHSLRVARWIEEGKVKPVIEDVFGLEDADNAYARIKGGKAAGKMVIVVGGDSGTAK
ncbi:Zinc-type alcohol dehydrogenase-like protein [Colletotrichum fructicola]|uniref:Zinc alcohol dehydrogenase n=2 Tax=Colletotrichum fructicola (strain Nara gc5) TaxID=1213859 RepID=L2FEG6_COLFN|nr:Zinc-type alcohol dehydrogenase-like protein [Colletotrichum fructicola]KAF4887501.1 Zinc-type alcohol dehydrogenase-like protein [Colletotrichum fructicola]KAF4910905.1 Zinc-type alcohol dehydrogenase-like protein [Colletotrichum fructicola]